jgi:hypothetical protein
MNKRSKHRKTTRTYHKTNYSHKKYNHLENREIVDQKLAELTEKCKITRNYKKLGVVFLILIRNKLEEIGAKFCLRSSDGPSYKYMSFINEFLNANFEFRLFSDDLLTHLKKIESQLSRRDEVGLYPIKEVIEIYYSLRDINVPNLLEENTELDEFQSGHSSLHSYALFRSISQSDSKKDVDQLNSLLLQKVKQKEAQLQRQLKEQYKFS